MNTSALLVFRSTRIRGTCLPQATRAPCLIRTYTYVTTGEFNPRIFRTWLSTTDPYSTGRLHIAPSDLSNVFRNAQTLKLNPGTNFRQLAVTSITVNKVPLRAVFRHSSAEGTSLTLIMTTL